MKKTTPRRTLELSGKRKGARVSVSVPSGVHLAKVRVEEVPKTTQENDRKMDIISIMSIFRVGRGRSKGDSSIFLCTKTRPEEEPPGKNIRRADMKQNSSTEKGKNSGFTLVELIVVIAILAILAAVAYPVYTGYIKKANEAADQVLLGAVNEAFRSALIDEGVYSGKPDNAMASFAEGSKTIGGVQYLINGTAQDLTEAFMRYFEGNEKSEFKVIEELGYNKLAGCFYGSYTTKEGQKILLGGDNSLTRGKTDVYGNTTWTWEKDGKTYSLTTNEQDLANFNDSSFNKNMTMEELMDEFSKVTWAAGSVLGNVNMDMVLTQETKDTLERLGYTPGTDEYKKAAINALVLQAAKQSDVWTTDDIVKYMKGDIDRLPTPESKPGDGFASVMAASEALNYGIITGFAKTEEGRNTHIKFWDESKGQYYDGTLGDYYDNEFMGKLNGATPSQAIGTMSRLLEALEDSDDYKSYLEVEGRKDIDGYLSALKFVRENNDEFVESGVVADGYGETNEDLTDLLSVLFGRTTD